MSGKGLLAIAMAVIAAVFLALVIDARSGDGVRRAASDDDDDDDDPSDSLERFGDCEEAVRHAVNSAGDRVEEMFGTGARSRVKEIASRRCREDAWPEEVTSCLRDATDASALSRCIGRLHPEAHAQLMTELERIPRAEPAPPDAAIDAFDLGIVEASDDAPPACLEYGRLIEEFSKCDKVPEATRSALEQAYAQVRAAWTNLPRDAWDTMDTACGQAVDAMKQAFAAMCP